MSAARRASRPWNVVSVEEKTMVGFITEQHLAQAEEEFPGIVRFFQSLTRKPRTFLELVTLYVRREA
jgi:hypothetical protein